MSAGMIGRFALGLAALAAAGAMMLPAGTPALASDAVKIGFVTTLTTPAAAIGNDMKDAVDLAIAHIDARMGGLGVEVIYEDDALRPEVGRQKTEKLLQQDQVDFVAGFIWSNVLLASARPVFDAGKLLISTNAGPSQLAGSQCHRNFFSTSWQNDQTPMAMGETLNQQGVKKLYVMAPNYAAGKDMVAGMERTFAGEVVGRDMTRWGADPQLDFSAELAKVAQSGADGLFVFYPGRAGPALVNQFSQAGLEGKIDLYSVFTVDAVSLPRLKEAGLRAVLGSRTTLFWDPTLDNEQNQKFVSAFREAYGRYPSYYAAQSYDAVFLIKAAVEAVGGDLSDVDGMRAAMEKADFPSVRGPFSYGNNHFPVQNFYQLEVIEDEHGEWTTRKVATVFEDHQDTHAQDCRM